MHRTSSLGEDDDPASAPTVDAGSPLLPATAPASVGAGPADAPVAVAPPAPPPPDVARIGPYHLLGLLGQGGMGAVYLAEQTEPVRRQVALKLIRPELASGQVLARFDAERQALALMDHPGIARVLDAGAAPGGRPYFVMELVRGLPITRFCEEHRLDLRRRLELFVEVCHAVQHAHQKGIIHRDLKPSNVLVTVVDDRPAPKVIDFGVAKATGGRRPAGPAPATSPGGVVGTLEYMSPEQALLGPIDLDTRTDVYALGVILYELITGTTPLDRAAAAEAGLEQLLRMVREAEPARPSTRLSTGRGRSAAGSAPASASRRLGVEPRRLTRMLRDDLDWVVMKALEKDRSRRYDSASALARDLQRYLAGEAVEACPPSAAYRLRKFARRNRGPLAAAAAIATLLVVGVVVSSVLAVRARKAQGDAIASANSERLAKEREATARGAAEAQRAAAVAARDEAERRRQQSEAITKYLLAAFRRPRPGVDGRDVRVADVLAQAAESARRAWGGDPAARAHVLSSIGVTQNALGLHREAADTLEAARDAFERELGPAHPDTLGSINNLAAGLVEAGRAGEALALFDDVARRLASLPPDAPAPGVAEAINVAMNAAVALNRAGRTDRAIEALEAARDRALASLGARHPTASRVAHNLGVAYAQAGQRERGLALLEEVARERGARLGPGHPETLDTLSNVAMVHLAAGRVDDGIRALESIMAATKERFGEGHVNALLNVGTLAAAHQAAGHPQRAVPILEEVSRRLEEALGADHPHAMTMAANLAVACGEAGDVPRAVELLERTLERRRSKLGDGHQDTLHGMLLLAGAYERDANSGGAERLLLEYVERREGLAASDLPREDAFEPLARILVRQGKHAEAERWARAYLDHAGRQAPGSWQEASAASILGAALMGRGNLADAEPLLVRAHAVLADQAVRVPRDCRNRIDEARERLATLYRLTGRPEKAAAMTPPATAPAR